MLVSNSSCVCCTLQVEVAVVDEEYKLWGLFPGAGESQGGVGGGCQSATAAAAAAAADSYTDPRVRYVHHVGRQCSA